MAAVASFLRSPAGRFHVAASKEFGQDPAAFLENDFVAFNLRAGALYLERSEAKREREERENPTLAMERWIQESQGG